MAAIDKQVLLAFERELEKNAFLGAVLSKAAPLTSKLSPALQFIRRGAGSAGAGMGLGTATGAAGGAAIGGYKGYREAKEQGQSGVAGALGGAAKGAGTGAMVGAATGLAGGMALGGTGTRLGQSLQNLGQASNPLGSIARFGQRQLHGVTGLTPGGAQRGTAEYAKAMAGMRMGAHPAAAGVLEAEMAVARAGTNPKLLEKATKALESAKSQHAIAQEAEAKGLTSLPGMVRSMTSKEGIKDVWRLGMKPQLTQQGMTGKMMAGLPVAFAAPELFRSQEQDPEGRGRLERFGSGVGSGVGYALSPFLPLVGQEAMGRAVGGVGKGLGKGVDMAIGALRGKKPQPPMTELGNNPSAPGVDPSGMNEAVPRIYSNAAQGKPPEGMMI